MNNRQKKHLLEKINRLSVTEHDEIFKMMRANNIPFTQNKNGVFFNLTMVSSDVLERTEQFVDYCIKNKKELDEYDKKLNECKLSNKYDKIWMVSAADAPGEARPLGAVLTETKQEDWQAVMQEIRSSEKLTSFVELLENNIDRIAKKKTNTKFANAKKRYARRLNTEKKFEAELPNNLEAEEYVVF